MTASNEQAKNGGQSIYRMYFELSGGLRIEEPFNFRGFRFQKTNIGQSVMFDFQAVNQKDADQKAGKIKEALERVLDWFSLEHYQGIQITYVNGPIVPGPHAKIGIVVPIDPDKLGLTEQLGAKITSTARCNPKVLLAARWFRKSLVATECPDVFLAAWISLEALAEERSRVLGVDETTVVQQICECVKNIVTHDKHPALRSRMIQDLLRATTKLSIPEAMAEVVEGVYGAEYKLLGQPIGRCLKALQKDRSDLVHNAVPITDVCEKASAIRDLAWRVVDALVRGHDLLRKLNTATHEELLGIQGIGPVIAKRIIDKRDTASGFGTLDELTDIPGIGEDRVTALRSWARLR